MKERNLRLPDQDRQALNAYFADRGLSPSAGVGMIILDLMRKEGLR